MDVNYNCLNMITIVAATDYSPVAENAVAYAAAIAKQYNARLLLFNVFTFSLHESNTLLPAASVSHLEAENNDRLKELAALTALVYDIPVSCETGAFCVEDELKSIAEKHDAALVVVGMAAESLEQDLLGNTTTDVIGKMHCPVLAVPLNARFTGWSKLLFACDLAQDKPQAALSSIKEKLTGFNPAIEVFYVNENGAVIETCEHEEIQSTAVIAEIRKEIASSGAQLLMMMPRKYGFWHSLVHRSKTRVMASGLNIPLLAVPASSIF